MNVFDGGGNYEVSGEKVKRKSPDYVRWVVGLIMGGFFFYQLFIGDYGKSLVEDYRAYKIAHETRYNSVLFQKELTDKFKERSLGKFNLNKSLDVDFDGDGDIDSFTFEKNNLIYHENTTYNDTNKK